MRNNAILFTEQKYYFSLDWIAVWSRSLGVKVAASWNRCNEVCRAVYGPSEDFPGPPLMAGSAEPLKLVRLKLPPPTTFRYRTKNMLPTGVCRRTNIEAGVVVADDARAGSIYLIPETERTQIGV